MVVFSNVINPQGLEPLQFPTKFRSHSFVCRVFLAPSARPGAPSLRGVSRSRRARRCYPTAPTPPAVPQRAGRGRARGALRVAGPGHAVADPALVDDQGRAVGLVGELVAQLLAGALVR